MHDISSPILEKPAVKKQLKILENNIKEAKKRIDYRIANDPMIKRALTVVEGFLQKYRRVCYGGQAINSHLSKARQFYDPKYSIPDYDFFTPDFHGDIDLLVRLLKEEGFENVYTKVSMHEGTMKILVNFVPVADCTQMDSKNFDILLHRAKNIGGILYADEEFLRMGMYLELSRPRGEVERWKKVYERLLLLNSQYPIKRSNHNFPSTKVTREREEVLAYCIEKNRVLVGPEAIKLMSVGKSKGTLQSVLELGGPIMFISSDAVADIRAIGGELVVIPCYDTEIAVIRKAKKAIAVIFQGEGCHSYSSLTLDSGDELRVGTHDLLLTLYYSVLIFAKRLHTLFTPSLDSSIQLLHDIEVRARIHPSEFVPSFGLKCSGHQSGIASLLKKRFARTHKVKVSRRTTRTRG